MADAEMLAMMQAMLAGFEKKYKQIELPHPLSKDNWLNFVSAWLKANDLAFNVDSDGDLRLLFGNGGTKYKGFDKDFRMFFRKPSSLSDKLDDVFVTSLIVMGDQQLQDKDKEKITEYLAMASFGLGSGSFVIMSNRMAFIVGMIGDKFTNGNELAATMLSCRRVFTRYYDNLPDILDGSLSASQAIKKTES